jgi:hypothetical protein
MGKDVFKQPILVTAHGLKDLVTQGPAALQKKNIF